jgi:transposase-like protein
MTEEILMRAVRKRRSNSSEQQMAEWARRFHESGLTQVEFARQHSLASTTLQRWVAEHPRVGRPVDPQPTVSACVPTFAEVKVVAASAESNWAAELSRPNGVVLRVGPNLPAALLEQLLRVC